MKNIKINLVNHKVIKFKSTETVRVPPSKDLSGHNNRMPRIQYIEYNKSNTECSASMGLSLFLPHMSFLQ